MYIFYNPTLTLTITPLQSHSLPHSSKQPSVQPGMDGRWTVHTQHGKKGDSPARALLVRGRHRPVDVGYHTIPFQSCLPSSNPPKITRVTSLLYSAPESPVERVSLPPSAHQPNRQCFGCIAPNGGRAYDKT